VKSARKNASESVERATTARHALSPPQHACLALHIASFFNDEWEPATHRCLFQGRTSQPLILFDPWHGGRSLRCCFHLEFVLYFFVFLAVGIKTWANCFNGEGRGWDKQHCCQLCGPQRMTVLFIKGALRFVLVVFYLLFWTYAIVTSKRPWFRRASVCFVVSSPLFSREFLILLVLQPTTKWDDWLVEWCFTTRSPQHTGIDMFNFSLCRLHVFRSLKHLAKAE